jgi:hypothetical protein
MKRPLLRIEHATPRKSIAQRLRNVTCPRSDRSFWQPEVLAVHRIASQMIVGTPAARDDNVFHRGQPGHNVVLDFPVEDFCGA